MQVTKKAEETPASVETIDQWKQKVAEVENCVGEVGGKFKAEKEINRDFTEIQAVLTNIQVSSYIDRQVYLFKYNLIIS